MKNRIIALIIAGLLTSSLFACGSKDADVNANAPYETEVQDTQNEKEADEIVALDSEEMGQIAEKSLKLADLMNTVAELGWEDEQTETEMKAVNDAANALTALMNGEETIKKSEVAGLLENMDIIIKGIEENTIPRIVAAVDGNVTVMEGSTWVISGGSDGETELNQEELDALVEQIGNITINFTSDSEFEITNGDTVESGTYEILDSVITMTGKDGSSFEAVITKLDDGTTLLVMATDETTSLYFTMVD